VEVKPSYSIIFTGGPAVIGDPHLGKKFTNGVPLDRRGEREAHQYETFRVSLHAAAEESSLVVMMGDLFDQYMVEGSDLYETYLIYKEVAEAHPAVRFVLIRGNHDVSRYIARRSSFDILAAMLEKFNNIIVVLQPILLKENSDVYLFFPYDAFQSTRELLTGIMRQFTTPGEKYTAIFGHWDIESFGGSDYNLCPFDLLAPTLVDGGKIITGHVHEAQIFTIPDETFQVIVTGSMLPYSHGEDSNGNIYVTMTLAEFEAAPISFRDKSVRLLLRPGQVPPDNIDALQISHKYVDDNKVEETEVRMTNFSFKELFEKVFSEHGLDEEVTNAYWEKYKEKNTDDHTA